MQQLEQTTVRFARQGRLAEMETTDVMVVARWELCGWKVQVTRRYLSGQPRAWRCTVPWRRVIRFEEAPVTPARIAA